jgi:hypothetical protein
MSTLAELEQRLAAVEHQLAELRRSSAVATANGTGVDWIGRIAEAFKDIPPEDIEAMHRYGREFRESHAYPGEDSP